MTTIPTISLEEYQEILQYLEIMTDMPDGSFEVMCKDLQGNICSVAVERVKKGRSSGKGSSKFNVMASVAG